MNNNKPFTLVVLDYEGAITRLFDITKKQAKENNIEDYIVETLGFSLSNIDYMVSHTGVVVDARKAKLDKKRLPNEIDITPQQAVIMLRWGKSIRAENWGMVEDGEYTALTIEDFPKESDKAIAKNLSGYKLQYWKGE